MGWIDQETSAGRTRGIVRVLVLLTALAVAVLLTRCPLANSPDAPVPPPRPLVR